MIIDYRNLRKHDGLFEQQGQVPLPDVAKTHNQVEDISEANVAVEAELTDDLCTVDGDVKYSVTYGCTRCLEPFVVDEKARLFEEFTDDTRRASDDIHLAVDGLIQLGPWVEQSVHLNLEVFPVCRPDCRGLCPVCGVNRNHHECNCDTRTVDPRLAALSDLLSTDESE